jgi:hypothetical protein
MTNDTPTPPTEEVLTKDELQMIQSRDHPHYGELGWLDKTTLQHATGQYYFKLSNCQHATAGCYVLESDLTAPSVALETKENLTKPTEFDPYKYSPETEAKLVEAFEMSYNVSEACQHAGISRDTYYAWIKEIDGFEATMEVAKSSPLKQAKGVIKDALKSGDISTAKWLLERKDPEFKPKAEVDNNLGLQETRKKLGDLLDERSADDFGEQPTTAPDEADGSEIPANPTDIS